MDQTAILKSLRETLTGHINASPGTPAFKAQCIQKLETLNRAQLEELLAKTAQESAQALAQAQDELLQVRAQRHAENTAHDLEHNLPKRQQAQKEAEDADRTTFAQAAKTLRTFSLIEANFQMIRSTLGTSFSVGQIKEMTEANSALLVPPNPHELNGWKYQDMLDAKAAEAQRIQYLKAMPHEQLREEVRAAGQQAHAAAAQSHAQQQLQVREEKEQGFPPLPNVDDSGRVIDSSYVIKLSNAPITSSDYKMFRHLCRRFGFAAVTRRLNGIS